MLLLDGAGAQNVPWNKRPLVLMKATAAVAKMSTWSQNLSSGGIEWRIGTVASVLAGGCAALFLYKWIKTPRNLPPGPPGLPFLGALPFLSSELHRDFQRFGQKYKSDVVSFYMGNSLTVALNSERVIRDAFAKEEYSGRPTDVAAFFQATDMLFSSPYSEEWRKNKKFMMQSLRTFGFGTPKSEEKITNQLKDLEEAIDAKDIEPWSKQELDKCLSKVTSNIIMEILFGCRYDFDDPELTELCEAVLEVQSVFFDDGATLFLFLCVIPNWFVKLVFHKIIQRARQSTQRLFNIAAKQLVDHRSRLDESEPTDFLDAALREYKNQPDITDKHIMDTLVVFLPDAIEAIAAQIQWCIYFLVSYPGNQRRMVEEIKSVCGNRPPNLQDRSTLPFCECVLLETLRASTLFTLSAPHKTTTDTTLDGYNIPAGTTVLGNIYAVQHDPDTFSLPEEFNPDRFLEESGSISLSTSLIPFCIGRRMCIGESLVKSEMFLAITRLVFLYHITSKGSVPGLQETKGILRRVPEYQLIFTKRM